MRSALATFTATCAMRATGVVRRMLWCGCLAALLLSGCARLIGKTASKESLPVDGEATFTPAAVSKPLSTPPAATTEKKTAVEETNAAASAIAQPAGVASVTKLNSPETKVTASKGVDTATLKADTLARLKTLPDVTPEQYAEFERALSGGDDIMPALYVQQLNALVKLRQEEATGKKQTLPGPAAVSEPPAANVAPTLTTTPATESATEPADEPTETPASTPPSAPKTLADRLRQSRSNAVPVAKETGIFGGKVQTASPAPPTEETTTQPHTTNKPATVETLPENDAPAIDPAVKTSWNAALSTAIVALEQETKTSELSAAERQQREASLRILYLLSDRRDDALREIRGLEPSQQDYWRSQIHSLQVSLATEGTPVPGRRATQALRSLREATNHLAAIATLDIQHLALCSQVTMWGNYQEFSKYEFKPDQEVLIYFEVENFTAVETDQGFVTEFVSSYEIFDSAGRRVAEQQFPLASETCRNRRRDYFIRYHMHVPKQLAAGEYTLQLTVEDQKGHKFGQGSLKFKVL